ncbi:hypothetical protein [Janthinobacterium fluminis]|uniref:Uncharacterized protein n=1 Tax=Janthinobacterium fluminis TaxID=2987524 RepID=A0ABT5JXM3_9BURK|nr:hypothetical protein [Janthinobacterium fluminis]MDC8757492.1 hypothetical protein [Janthinobacterium fluminis]
MPDQSITLDDTERDLLERIRQQQGLSSIEQAGEWLLKSSVRKSAKGITGRGRALYQVERKHK